MLEQLIAEYLIEAKRGVYADAYVSIDVNRVAEELAEEFIDSNEVTIENFIEDFLLRRY